MIDYQPRIQLNRADAFVTQITSKPCGRGFDRYDVEKALGRTDLTSREFETIVYNFDSLPTLYKERQPPRQSHRRIAEFVIANEVTIGGRQLPAFRIGFFDSAARPQARYVRDWPNLYEIIFGIKGKGLLGIMSRTKNVEDVVITAGTLAVLHTPNYWKDFGALYRAREPRLQVLLLTYPSTYRETTPIKVRI